jgi:hypothetical protein
MNLEDPTSLYRIGNLFGLPGLDYLGFALVDNFGLALDSHGGLIFVLQGVEPRVLMARPLGSGRARRGSPIGLIGAHKDSMSYTNSDSFGAVLRDPTNIIFLWS